MKTKFFVIVAIAVLLAFVIYPFDKSNTIVNVSIDDIDNSLKDLYGNDKYESVFQQPFFAYLKSCHTKYDTKFSLYIYADGGGYSDKFKNEFQQNKDWLQFGFHAINPAFNKEETEQFINFCKAYNHVDSVIDVFAGKELKASTLRLHYYFATPMEVYFLRKKGITRLLSADDERISYSLPTSKNKELIEKNTLSYKGMNYRRTNIRLEKMCVPPIDMRMTPKDTTVFFTHESQLASKKGRLKFEYCLFFMHSKGCKFNFL